jgi:N-acetyl-alpha-D-glucosaminyl L-malate synthase BshA
MFGVNREIEVIHNFICPSHFERKADEQFRRAVAPNGEPIITHISNFRPVKRVEDVVDVFAGVRAKQPAKLLLVGDGPERVRAEKRAEERGVRSDVVSIGKIKNPIEPLLVSDLFLLPSETESFGLSALEALAAGVPVIASDAGGLPEVIEHGVCGYLAPVGDVDAMARYAHAVLDERNERAAFKAAALARAQEFHVMKILPHYEAIYHRLTP